MKNIEEMNELTQEVKTLKKKVESQKKTIALELTHVKQLKMINKELTA